MEIRECNVCGERWFDTGDYQCPFCGATDTRIEDDKDEDEERGET